MRYLRLVFSRTEGLKSALVAATLLPLADACGAKHDAAPPNGDAGLGSAGASAGAAAGSTSTSPSSGGNHMTVLTGTSGSFAIIPSAEGGLSGCPSYGTEISYVVPLPSKGEVAEMAQLCGWNQDFTANSPVAWIELVDQPGNAGQASGVLTLSSTVLDNAGYLVVTSISVDAGSISNLRQIGAQYHFDVVWRADAHPVLGDARTFQINITTACAPARSATQDLQVTSIVQRCGSSFGTQTWVSGGDTCTHCEVMTEFAPMPMPPPSNAPDGLPLPGELVLTVSPVARDGRYLVLELGKPEGLTDLSVAWHVSAGNILLVGDDLAVWTLPDTPGPHQVQVAAEAGDSAGIGIYLHRNDPGRFG